MLKTILFNVADFAEHYTVFRDENPDWQIASVLVNKAAKICLNLNYQPSSMFPEGDSICMEYNWFKGQYLYFSIREEQVLMVKDHQDPISISPSEINGYIWNILEPNVFQLILVSNGLTVPKEQYNEYICAASNLFPDEIIRCGFANMSERSKYLYRKWQANQFKAKVANMYGLSVATLVPGVLKEDGIPYHRLEKVYEDEEGTFTVALAVGPLTNKEMQEIVAIDRQIHRKFRKEKGTVK